MVSIRLDSQTTRQSRRADERFGEENDIVALQSILKLNEINLMELQLRVRVGCNDLFGLGDE
jgi:hypothetical protein